jgi:hypothetical protein
MSITPLELYKIANPITDDKKHLNKYTFLGNEFNFPHYRILSLRDVMLKGMHTRMPKYLLDFISENGEVLLIANIISGYIPLIQLRTLRGEKKFIALGNQSKLFYGLGYLNKNFKFGDWIIIVEGIADADIIRGIYPNVLATMTSRITRSQFEVLKLLTNKVILIGDNDIPGRKGTKLNRVLLKEAGFDVRLIFQYGDMKDCGELADFLLQNDGQTFNSAVKYYEGKINNILGV